MPRTVSEQVPGSRPGRPQRKPRRWSVLVRDARSHATCMDHGSRRGDGRWNVRPPRFRLECAWMVLVPRLPRLAGCESGQYRPVPRVPRKSRPSGAIRGSRGTSGASGSGRA